MKKQIILSGLLFAFMQTTIAQEKIFIYKSGGSLLSETISNVDSITTSAAKTDLLIHKKNNTVLSFAVNTIDSVNFRTETTVAYTAPPIVTGKQIGRAHV